MTIEDDVENFNLHVPGWVARRPRLVDWCAGIGERAVRDIAEEERRGR